MRNKIQFDFQRVCRKLDFPESHSAANQFCGGVAVDAGGACFKVLGAGSATAEGERSIRVTPDLAAVFAALEAGWPAPAAAEVDCTAADGAGCAPVVPAGCVDKAGDVDVEVAGEEVAGEEVAPGAAFEPTPAGCDGWAASGVLVWAGTPALGLAVGAAGRTGAGAAGCGWGAMPTRTRK